MYGNSKSINSINKVIKISKSRKFKNVKIIYCPPYTLLSEFVKKTKNAKISIGAQNCHTEKDYGSYTGFISAKMIKDTGSKYVILGHSENRISGETNEDINKKIKSAIKKKLNVILCVGENLAEKRKNITKKVLSYQINKSLNKVKNINNIIIAYEPVWSIGTGIIPKKKYLEFNVRYIKQYLSNKFYKNKIKILYGGSVDSKNAKYLMQINEISGFLVGGASKNSKKFIDIIKKTIK